MSLGFQYFNGTLAFWIFVKRVNNVALGTYSKTEFMFDFDEIMKNSNLSNEEKSRQFFNFARFYKDRMILFGDLFDYVLNH